uniref:Uncharacterized protein n=1 Tax=Aegilops tauschii subsp. strangulata TaxID=200361 RepID=A0A453I5C4_AEGTS
QKVKEETTSPFPSPPSPDYFLSPKRLASSPIPPRSKGLAMETSASGAEPANAGIEGSADPCSSAGGGHRLSVHQIVGGGKGNHYSSTPSYLLPFSAEFGVNRSYTTAVRLQTRIGCCEADGWPDCHWAFRWSLSIGSCVFAGVMAGLSKGG